MTESTLDIPQATPVGVAVRFVPVGILQRDGDWYLQGTLLLSPAAGSIQGACAQSVHLSHWPSEIEALLTCERGIQISIQPVRAGEARPAPKLDDTDEITLFARRADLSEHNARNARPRDQVRRLTKFWQDIMPASLNWEGLANGLKAGAASVKSDGSRTDILSNGHGDMSLLLPLERATSVLSRMATAGQPRLSASTDFDRPGERLLTREGDNANRCKTMPWLLERAELRGPPAPADIERADFDDRTRDREFAVRQSKATNESLKTSRQAAAVQLQTRTDYQKSPSAKAAGEHLKAMSQRKPAGITPVAAASGAALEANLDHARTRHFAGSRPDTRTEARFAPPPKPNWADGELPRARFFALQAQPALARVFNLVVDVIAKVSDSDLAALKAALPCQENITDQVSAFARFVFVSARLGERTDAQVVWTTAKLRLPFPDEPLQDEDLHFWACTREELDARAAGWQQAEILAAAVAPQIDGLIDLAASTGDGQERSPRFELATLDVRRATEGDLHADAQAAARTGKETAVATLPSGGLLLLDRWRQFQALAKHADRAAREPEAPIVIDAEDLTVGIRLDIGVEVGKNVVWRSLVERRITYEGTPVIDQAMQFLVPDARARSAFDAAPLVHSTRKRANEPELGRPESSLFTDEIVAHWNGPPLGIDLYGSGAVSRGEGEGNDTLPPILPLAQIYSLPDSGDARPPRQCFGWPVRVGARPQLEGGIARPLIQASRAYESGFGRRFSLPPMDPGVRGRRLLRHERIEHPVVTTPLDILRRLVPGPQETALELVVRSRRDENGKITRSDPAATHRVFIPPPVSMVFADHHDVFSEDRLEFHGVPKRRRPRGGLRDVAYDRKGSGTFPIWSTQQSSEGGSYPDETLPPPKNGVPDLENQQFPVPTGDAVFMPLERNQNPADRSNPYYPDPAAELMVFRLRRQDGTPVDEPLVVRVRRSGVTYPDVTPVVLELVQLTDSLATGASRLGLDVGTTAVPRLVHGADAWTHTAARVFIDETTTIHRSAGRFRVEATRVVARLAPDERLQLDVWCLPRWETLEYLFDLVEAAAQVVQCSGPAAGSCLTGRAFCLALAATLQRDVASVLAAMQMVEGLAAKRDGTAILRSTPAGNCGAGQLPLPGPAELATMAFLMQQAAQMEVTPELAARTTVWLTHAVDKPIAPDFIDGDASPGLEVRRKPDQNGRDHVVLTGLVTIDPASTGFLEIRAAAPGLVSGNFDSLARGRTVDDQARGIWPGNGLLETGDPAEPWRKPEDVFGFEVEADGAVALKGEQATLMRIDGVAETPGGPAANWIDFDSIERGIVDSNMTVTRPHTIGDTKARVLTITLVAGSRTAPFIRRPDGAALRSEEQTTPSPDDRRILLPSAKAPSRVDPLTIVPAFLTEQSGLTATRNIRLRIRARRPWFSSGDGERLGIVLWPPNIFARAARIAQDFVDLDFDPGGDESPLLDVEGFSDAALGAGGEFVTRWGADPTQAGPAPASWLIPPSAFIQANLENTIAWSPLDEDADEFEVVYVPYAVMPLPKNPTGTQTAQPTMTVALLAFRPRFDVDGEYWYFDVAIDPAAALEPFVRFGLVRYQANAPEKFRVSEPVAEWAQLLPQRTATVEPKKSDDGRFIVSAEVSGPAANAASPADPDPVLSPTMLFQLFRTDADGMQALIAQKTTTRLALGPTGTTWKAELDVPEDAEKPEPGTQYSVVVTEHNVMRKSTYAEEPFDEARADTDQEAGESGPRFAARINIPVATGMTRTAAEEGSTEERKALGVHDTKRRSAKHVRK